MACATKNMDFVRTVSWIEFTFSETHISAEGLYYETDSLKSPKKICLFFFFHLTDNVHQSNCLEVVSTIA